MDNHGVIMKTELVYVWGMTHANLGHQGTICITIRKLKGQSSRLYNIHALTLMILEHLFLILLPLFRFLGRTLSTLFIDLIWKQYKALEMVWVKNPSMNVPQFVKLCILKIRITNTYLIFLNKSYLWRPLFQTEIE